MVTENNFVENEFNNVINGMSKVKGRKMEILNLALFLARGDDQMPPIYLARD